MTDTQTGRVNELQGNYMRIYVCMCTCVWCVMVRVCAGCAGVCCVSYVYACVWGVGLGGHQPDDHVCHLGGGPKLGVVDADDGDDSADVVEELLVGVVQPLQVLHGDAALAVAAPPDPRVHACACA